MITVGTVRTEAKGWGSSRIAPSGVFEGEHKLTPERDCFGSS